MCGITCRQEGAATASAAAGTDGGLRRRPLQDDNAGVHLRAGARGDREALPRRAAAQPRGLPDAGGAVDVDDPRRRKTVGSRRPSLVAPAEEVRVAGHASGQRPTPRLGSSLCRFLTRVHA